MTKKKESHGLKASKILYVVNALWRKKAMLQILFDWRSCPVGLLCIYIYMEHNAKLEMEIIGSSRTFLLHTVPIYSYFRLFKNTSFCKTGHFRILIINVPTYHLTCRQYFLGTLCTTFLVGPP